MQDQKRLVYIEDSENWREIIGNYYTSGLTREGMTVEVTGDFSSVRRDFNTGELADVYVTDNEVLGEEKTGAETALDIARFAHEIQKPVTIITLLSSNPAGVRRGKDGKELDLNKIQTLDKLEDAGLTGFYFGSILDRGLPHDEDGNILDYYGWMQAEGLIRPTNTQDSSMQTLSSKLLTHRDQGILYTPIREYALAHWNRLTRWVEPESVKELERLINIGGGKIERK